MNFADVYRGRHVLVTGHTGFKGGWLSTWLLELGADVTGLSLAPVDQPNLYEALGLEKRLKSHIGDIRDEAIVKSVVDIARPEIIFHLAAQPLVRIAHAKPIDTFTTNIIGTAHVLDAACKASSVKALVCVTTDKVYENREWPWPYRETDRLGGHEPYSASKACAELVTIAYQNNLRRITPAIEIATARGGNVVGGGDWSADRIVPDIVRAIISDESIILRNPSAVRPWQHVLELCEGYLELGARLYNGEHAFAEAWNFGPNSSNATTVQSLTNAVLHSWNLPLHSVEIQSSAISETQLLRLDTSKATSRLFWRPRLNIAETLNLTTQWYKEFYNGKLDTETLTRKQISDFNALRATSSL